MLDKALLLEELAIREKIARERVAPKFDEWRKHYRYKIAYGGRGAGAKSHSATSLLVQASFAGLGDWFKPPIRVLCLREIQLSIEESSKALIEKKIDALRYPGFTITETRITNKLGSEFLFRGLKDIRAARNVKSYEDFDIFFIEEAAAVQTESLQMILPTLRKPMSELWAVFNREEESDPIYEMFVQNPRPNSCILELKPGGIDNPWFEKSALPAEMAEDYKRDPDLAEHTWGGQPRSQGINCVMSRTAIRAAMDRNIEHPDGAVEVGVDVARFGDDSTQMYKRKGFKVIAQREMRKSDTIQVSDAVRAFRGEDKVARTKIDEGYNPGVVDLDRRNGGNVIAVAFGGDASDKDKYANAATEMWFEFPVDQADIPNDPELMRQLSGRRYGYDKQGRKIVEPKDEYKKRNGGKSPDKADALLLAYYVGRNVGDASAGAALDARRSRHG